MSALGDCVMVLTAIRALRLHSPESKITWIIQREFLPLFENEPGITFIPIKKPRSIKSYCLLKKQLSGYSFDVLFAMQASLRSNLIYPLIKAKRKIGFDTTRGKELHGLFIHERIPFKKEHLLEGFMAFNAKLFDNFSVKISLQEFKEGYSVNQLELPIDSIWVEEKLEAFKGKKILAMNPAASKIERCCQASFYSKIISLAQEKGFAVLLTGGPSKWEQELSENILQQLQDRQSIMNLVGKTSLLELALILAKVDVLIAPDTGPAHLADLIGTQVIGLYAVAPPAQTGPYRNMHRVQNAYPEALRVCMNTTESEVKWGTRVYSKQAMCLFSLDLIKSAIDQAYNAS